MTYEYDFEMVKRAYAEMARRAGKKTRCAGSPETGCRSRCRQPQIGRLERRQPYPARTSPCPRKTRRCGVFYCLRG
jgi:hypothetical protein